MTQWIVDLLDRHPTIRQAPGYYVDWVHGVLVFGDYRVVPTGDRYTVYSIGASPQTVDDIAAWADRTP